MFCHDRNLIAENIRVRCGEWDFDDASEITHQDRKAKSVHIHPQYILTKKNIPNNDAALIYTEDFNLTPYVDTICLPEEPVNIDSLKNCFATGYGKDKFGKRK